MPDSTFAERAEQFYGELMREHYQVGAGLKDDLELTAIYRRYADLFAESTVRERIAAMEQSLARIASIQGRAAENAQVLGAKEAQHLAEFGSSSYIDNEIKELTEAITNAELKAVIQWDERQIPYRQIHSVIVREPDSQRRHALLQLQLAVMIKQNPQRIQRIKGQHEIAKRLGFTSYRAMVERLRGWDLPVLSKALEPFVEETEDTFDEKLELLLADTRVSHKEANISDISYIMRAPEFDADFPAAQLVNVLRRTVAGMEMPLESTPGLHLDTEARPRKSPRAFCAPVRVPSEVYLVIKPVGGQDDYRALFHESGHAEHFSHIEKELPLAFRYLGDEAISETFAFLFEGLTYTPRWLVDVLRVPIREAERYQRFALFNKLWLVRRYAAKLRYELVLHDDGTEGVDTAYRDILTDVLHVGIPPERYLEDVDDAFYVAGYLRAWIFERQLGRFMLESFGEGWYESREAGKFFRSLWSAGLRDPVDEIARTRLGAKGLDPRILTEELAEF